MHKPIRVVGKFENGIFTTNEPKTFNDLVLISTGDELLKVTYKEFLLLPI